LENGPWPSFVTGLKRLAQDDHAGAGMVRDVLATLETSYVTKKVTGKVAPLVLSVMVVV
jgi:hypothetical protein